PAGTANTPARQFGPGQALEVFIYGDGSGNRFRLMTRDGIPTLEGSQWMSIDWTGWRRVTWNYNDPDNVVGWVNGDGVMDGEVFYFDSFQITKDLEGAATSAMLYFDDLRIVDPFNVVFNIADADGTEVIAIDNVTYDEGDTDFMYFPGTYQYFVYKDGFETYMGTFEVDDADLDIDITLTAGDDPTYTLTFTVMDEEMELITDAVITIEGESHDAGEYVFELTPGFYNYVVSRDLYFDSEGMVVITDGNVFENVIMEEIPDVYDNVYLSWDVASTATTPVYREEYYSVWIAVDPGEELNPEEWVMVFEETLESTVPGWEYQHRSLEISAFQQQNIRVAFRHHDITDKDRIVIDNIKIEGIEASLDLPDILLFEDFEGGVPDDFDPADGLPEYDEEWLPEGWEAIDYDNDGFNWYFAMRIEQDLTYHAHMRSQSWDGEGQTALTPDNWLISPMITMPWVLYYPIVFEVVDGDGNVIPHAVITLDGVEYEPGQYEFNLNNGIYEYIVTLEDYDTAEGSFEVAGEGKTVEVVLFAIEYFNVTFNVNMNQADGFVIGETDVYMTGDFPQWEWAEPGTYEDQQLEPTDNVYVFTTTLQLAAGTYHYKYFDGPSWADGEWPGDPNREVEVEGDMVIDDVFGIQDDTFVGDPEAMPISIFPNPARDVVTISADSQITEVSIYNLGGQLLYHRNVSSNTVTVNLSGLNPGLYLIKVTGENHHAVNKLQIAY
ncbi:MAG: T9SS type A sorting domain-containing protein, partial [Bacteroidales bacterium]|nr:T9SS type A sorting domain-containing protein [Bacteroidales bacterium]